MLRKRRHVSRTNGFRCRRRTNRLNHSPTLEPLFEAVGSRIRMILERRSIGRIKCQIAPPAEYRSSRHERLTARTARTTGVNICVLNNNRVAGAHTAALAHRHGHLRSGFSRRAADLLHRTHRDRAGRASLPLPATVFLEVERGSVIQDAEGFSRRLAGVRSPKSISSLPNIGGSRRYLSRRFFSATEPMEASAPVPARLVRQDRSALH